MKEILLDNIKSDLERYNTIDIVINQKAEDIQKRKDSPDLENTSVDEKIKLAQEANIDLIFFASDQRLIFNRLFFSIDLYLQVYKEIPKEAQDFYSKYKIFNAKEMFVIKDGNVIEKEDGALQKAREDYVNNNPFLKSLIDSAK